MSRTKSNGATAPNPDASGTGTPGYHPGTGYATKSDAVRAAYAAGFRVRDIEIGRGIAPKYRPVGYAFAYGIASRTPDPANPGKSYADTRADRKSVRAVSRDADGNVSVRTAAGTVTVRPDGTVVRPGRSRK